MSFQIKQDGTWKDAQDIYAKKDGNWNQASEVYRKQNGSWCLVFQAEECNFTVDPQFTNFDSLGVSSSGFPEIRAELTIDNNTYGTDGSLDASNFQVCEDNTIEAVTNVIFGEGSGSKIDLLITFDGSGSMDGPRDQLVPAIQNLIDDVEANNFDARYGLTRYEAQITHLETLTTDGQQYKNSVSNILTDGGSEPGWDAITSALGQRSDGNGTDMPDLRDDAQKVLLNVSDEPSNSNSFATRSDTINALENQQVEFKTVSPNSNNNSDYKSVADELGNQGTFYDISGDISSHFNEIFSNLTDSSYRVFYDTSNTPADGSIRTTQIKVIPPADSPDDNMVVERSYGA